MKRIPTLMLAVALTAGLVAGCGSKPQDGYNKPNLPDNDAPPVTLKIGQMPTPDGLPFWVAEAKDYYTQQGVNVELITFKSANERDAALMGGQIDGMLTDPMGAITLYATGTPVKIVSLGLGATPQEGVFGIVSAPGSGITELSQLKGVEIANSTNTITHYVMDQLLKDAGFTDEEIQITGIPSIPIRYDALMNGQVQAALLPDPWMTLAKLDGGTVIISDAQGERNYSQSVIAFTEQALQEKHDGIRRMLLAYNSAVADIRLNPTSDEYLQLLVDKASLPVQAKLAYASDGVAVSFAQAPAKEDLESVITWLLEKNFIDHPLTYEELVDTSVLPSQQ